MFWVFLGTGNLYCTSFIVLKCLSTKRIKTNREFRNAAIFVLVSTYTTIALPVGRLARVMTRVTFETPCHICTSFTDEQLKKIQNRKRYLKKQKAEASCKDNELDLLGEGDSFTGSNADLESAADNLFTSPPPPSSATCLQFFISQNTSQVCPTQVCPTQVQLYNKKFKQILKNPWVVP